MGKTQAICLELGGKLRQYHNLADFHYCMSTNKGLLQGINVVITCSVA